ncbi:MAG TPA: hypothetical protein VD963_04670 [Phycisphaerales bacterium]|nr:hypothetical protein [Phycisphaerales bacterium]
MRHTTVVLLSALPMLGGAPIAGRQKTPPAGTPPAPDVLRGPVVAERGRDSGPASLVRRDFAGRLERPEGPAPEAALALLVLTPGEEARARAVLLERAAVVDRLVLDNLELLLRAQGLAEAEPAARARLVVDLAEAARPLTERGTMAQELERVLSAENGRRLRALVSEYVREAARERATGAASGSARPTRAELRRALAAEAAEAVGLEFRLGVERTIGAAGRQFEELLQDLALSPEQEGRVRQIVGAAFEQSYGKLGRAERAAVFVRVWSVLEPDQQRRLAQLVIDERRRGGPGTADRGGRDAATPRPETPPAGPTTRATEPGPRHGRKRVYPRA